MNHSPGTDLPWRTQGKDLVKCFDSSFLFLNFFEKTKKINHNTMKNGVLLLSLASTVYALSCETDYECSLGGECSAAGECVCDPGFTGKYCSALAFKPAPSVAAFR